MTEWGNRVWVERGVIRKPTPQHRVDPSCEVIEGQVHAPMKPPGRHPSAHLVQLPRRGGRKEARKGFPPTLIRRLSGPERVAAEHKRDVLVGSPAIAVLAIHDRGLVGVKLQPDLDEPACERLPHLATVLCSSRILPLRALPLAASLPAAVSGYAFTRSIEEPRSGSCCLYAGCRLVSTRVTPRLVPGPGRSPGFDIVFTDFDTSTAEDSRPSLISPTHT